MRRLGSILGRGAFWGHVPDIGEQKAENKKSRFMQKEWGRKWIFFMQNEEDKIFNKLGFKLKWSAQLREIPVSLKHAQHLFKVWDFGEIPTRLH